jgi:beta-glucanase (GH16 family)
MKNILLLCFSILTVNSFAQKGKLIWEENFDGTELNENYWNFELGDGCPNLCGWGNNEAQIYTKDNHQVKDGNLIITAKLENGIYSSTRITTKGKKEFKYGRIEARGKLPLGEGLWPAFWMLGSNILEVGWPTCGEIDILEYVGRERENIFTSVHTADSHGMTKNTRKDVIKGIEEGFHTYAIEWTEDNIDFLIDGELFYTFIPENKSTEVWPFNQPFFIIVNMAIGGNFGGPDIDDSIFPQEFVLDYIKVYEY